MSKSINSATILGRLTKAPEVKYIPSGQAVATIDIATNEKYKDKSGNWQESTEYHRVVLWARLAEIAGEYLTKGSQVYIEGKIQTRSWEKDGVKKYATEIVGRELILLDAKNDQVVATRSEAPAVDDEPIPF